MLEVLKKRLIDGLTIVSVKETHAKYKIEFEYEGERTTAELPKSCAPNCHNEVADYTIKTAMSNIYFNRGDYVKAKEWLYKQLRQGKGKKMTGEQAREINLLVSMIKSHAYYPAETPKGMIERRVVDEDDIDRCVEEFLKRKGAI